MAALVATTLCTLPAHADETPAFRPTVSRQGGGGLSLYMPFAQAQVGWRLPVGDHHWELIASQTLWHGTWTSAMPAYSLLGARYYLNTTGDWQTFAVATAGAGYNLPYTTSSGDTREGRFLYPVAGAGMGFDWMPWDHLGLSGQILVAYPMFLRPKLSVRTAF